MTNSDGRSPSRRRLLKRVGLGLGAGVSLLAGCGERPGPTSPAPTTEPGTRGPGPGTPTGTPGGPDDERANYGTVVNMVDVGADPEGKQPINSLLRDHAGDDTILYFPEGEYLMDRGWEFREFEHFGILGENATIRPPEGYSDYLFAFGWSDRAIDFLFKGVDFDATAASTAFRPIHATIQDGLHVEDVEVRGVMDADQDSFRFDVTRSDGTGLVRNLRHPDGGDARWAITGVYVGEVHEGLLTFRDCHVANFPDNGIYASQANGPVHVVGGLFENNNVANVRVTTGAVVRGATVRSTKAKEGFNNVRGIRLRSGRDVLVEDCTLEFTDVVGSNGAITMHNWLESATVRNTRIRVDTDDVPAIQAKTPAKEVRSKASGLRFENVQISGTAANRAAIEIDERTGCDLSGICIHQTGGSRNGIRLLRSSETALRDSTIQVTGNPIVVKDSTLSRRNVQTGQTGRGTPSTQCQ